MTIYTLEYVADRLAISDLFVRYANALDFKRWEDLNDVFVENATALWFGKGHSNSRAEIVEFIRDAIGHMPLHHFVGNFVADITGDTADAQCHMRAHHQGVGERSHLYQETLGIFRAKVQRINGTWRVTHWDERMLAMNGTYDAVDKLPDWW
jgi:hypothetical protein